MSRPHILLVDASGFAHRAYHAGNPTYRSSDGMPTWAVLGFLHMVWKMLGAAQVANPTHGVAAFDVRGKTFRHDLYPEYKNRRPAARADELEVQLPYMRHAAETLGFYPLEVAGFEADDVIATLARRADDAGMMVTIVTSDKDMGQLVVDGRIEIVDPMMNKRIGEPEILERWGVPPRCIPDVQALCGDAVDDIPGVPGCGQKRAAMLIRRFGSIEGVMKDTRLVKWPSVERELNKRGTKSRLQLYRELTRLRVDVPVADDFEAMRLKAVERSHIMEILKFLEAAHKYDALFGTSTETTLVVDRVANSMAWWRAALVAMPAEVPLLPQEGFYRTRLIRGGPWVPCRIWREPQMDFITENPTGKDLIRCEVNGKPRNPVRQWDYLSRYPIPREKYDFMVANAAWAKQHAPEESVNTPEKPIDWLKEPV